jgi:hypothetical protein
MALPRSEPDVRYDIRSLQSARPSNARDGAAGQLLRKASVVLDAGGRPDDSIHLGDVISWIKSLSASVSNGLRSILKFGGAVFAASL